MFSALRYKSKYKDKIMNLFYATKLLLKDEHFTEIETQSDSAPFFYFIVIV